MLTKNEERVGALAIDTQRYTDPHTTAAFAAGNKLRFRTVFHNELANFSAAKHLKRPENIFQ